MLVISVPLLPMGLTAINFRRSTSGVDLHEGADASVQPVSSFGFQNFDANLKCRGE